MNSSFWTTLPKPFFALAPMANVTDVSFRRIIAGRGKPHVMWTEFVSADGLFLGGKRAQDILMKDLLFTSEEKPIVAQFFTGKPELMEKAAALTARLEFDGVDINMGCPDRTIEKQDAGAALIKDSARALALIEAARHGARGLPVSVKTRIGYSKKEEMEEWLAALLSTNLSALTIHLRTRKEMSKVPAHWELLPRIVAMRDAIAPETLIVGNGDGMSIEEAKKKAGETGADGIMLGKAIFGNPWLFADPPHNPTVEEKLQAMVEHTNFFEELLGDVKNFSIMKKHYKAYAEGFSGAKELRAKLMETKTAREVRQVVEDFLVPH